MNTKISRFAQTILIVFLLSSLIFATTDSHVKGQTGTVDAPFPANPVGNQSVIEGTGIVPGGPGFIMISPYDFKPMSPSYAWWYYGGGLYNSGIPDGGFVAGVTLPHNARVTKFTLYYKDNHDTKNISINLYRGDGQASIHSMASLYSTGQALAFQTLSTSVIIEPVVDDQNYSYIVYVGLPGNVGDSIILANVRIDYEYSTNLPCVMN